MSQSHVIYLEATAILPDIHCPNPKCEAYGPTLGLDVFDHFDHWTAEEYPCPKCGLMLRVHKSVTTTYKAEIKHND